MKVLLVLLTLCASDAQDQVWPEVDVYAGTGHNTRLNFLYSSTRVHEEGYSDGQLGVNMDFYFSPLEGRILHRHADVVRNHAYRPARGLCFLQKLRRMPPARYRGERPIGEHPRTKSAGVFSLKERSEVMHFRRPAKV